MQINLLQYEKQKHENIYYNPQDCNPDGFSQGPRPISISQVQTVPWLMLGMCLLAIIVMATERFVCPASFGQSSDDEENSESLESLQEETLLSDLMDFYAMKMATSLPATEIVQQKLDELRRLITEDRFLHHRRQACNIQL